MLNKENLEIIKIDFWFDDEVTCVGGNEVMIVKEISITEEFVNYGCLKHDGTISWFPKSRLKGFTSQKSIGFIRE